MKKSNIIHVKSADSGQDTIAQVIVRNKISHNPTVSVIMPVYNVAPYLRQCMDSVVNQTLHDIEIICVNDCGTDNRMQIVNQFAKKDTRIKVINNPHNMGIADTRNVGLNAATAPYIMWCDPDDWMQPDMCEKMYNAITKNKSDIAVCGTNVVYETDNKIAKTDIGYFNIANNETVDGKILRTGYLSTSFFIQS